MNNGAVNLHQLFDLVADGGDAYVGDGLEYPWGGLYGGHIVAQALRRRFFYGGRRYGPALHSGLFHSSGR